MAPSHVSSATLARLPPFKPDLLERAWCSIPHPTLPLLATAYARSVTVFSLATLSKHSALTGGHSRSVRSVAWRPPTSNDSSSSSSSSSSSLCLVTGSFDSTAGVWRWQGELPTAIGAESEPAVMPRELDMTRRARSSDHDSEDDSRAEDAQDAASKDWEFTLVLDGHDSEIKCATFSPSGVYLATCSRDKSVWIWEDVGATEADDEWETVAVLNEHDGDVKAVAWCPDVPGRTNGRARRFGADVLASASYDNSARIWREDSDGDWVCVAVLEGHAGTVWGVHWEGRPREGDLFPRLMTFSADGTIRIWTLAEGPDSGDTAVDGPLGGLRGIPNTMRTSLREDWKCTAVLPAAHSRGVYSAAWSAKTGLIASTGSDGCVVIYAEGPPEDVVVSVQGTGSAPPAWKILAQAQEAHGAYEVNHITWCPQYDAAACACGGGEGAGEMLVTTGDDGLVRPWNVTLSTDA